MGETKARPPRWHWLFFAGVGTLSLGFLGAAAARLLVLGQDIDFVNQLQTTPIGELREQWQELVSNETLAGGLYYFVGIGMCVTVGFWIRRLNKALATPHESKPLRRLPAMVAWRISLYVAIALGVFGTITSRRPTIGQPIEDLVGYDHWLMWWIAPQVALCALCGWVAMSLLRFGNRELPRTVPVSHLLDDPDARPRMW